MKKIVLVLCLAPVLCWSQSKRKKRLAEERANMVLLTNLKNHVQYLADDKLEGRRTGTAGEEMAMQYIADQYRQMGIEPGGSQGYIQKFEINEGRQVEASTHLLVDGKQLQLEKEYIPLAFSAAKKIQGTPAMALNEFNQPWFKDLKEWLEENKSNPHFNIEELIKKEADAIAGKGATALFIYNTSGITDNIQYNKHDTSSPVKIPVVYITKDGYARCFSDNAATLPLELHVSFSNKTRKAKNVIGFINNNAATTIILGAHYDHLGYGEDKNALDTAVAIHNGADDNASGAAALIELARMLKSKSPLHNNYLLIHFSGEELGLFGSKYWIEHPTVTITPNYMINMDMVGRYDTTRKLTIGGYGTSPVWGEVWKALPLKLAIKFDSTGGGPSDHASFYRSNIPVQFFFTGNHSDYHKATDDRDKINYEGQRDIVKLVYELINVTAGKGKLPFAKTTEPQMGRSTRFTVSLGLIPDYGFSGTGLRIDGVSPGKLAEKIGLQTGDILLQLGEYKFVDVMSYSQTLGRFNKGDKTQLRIKRGNEEKEFDIEF